MRTGAASPPQFSFQQTCVRLAGEEGGDASGHAASFAGWSVLMNKPGAM